MAEVEVRLRWSRDGNFISFTFHMCTWCKQQRHTHIHTYGQTHIHKHTYRQTYIPTCIFIYSLIYLSIDLYTLSFLCHIAEESWHGTVGWPVPFSPDFDPCMKPALFNETTHIHINLSTGNKYRWYMQVENISANMTDLCNETWCGQFLGGVVNTDIPIKSAINLCKVKCVKTTAEQALLSSSIKIINSWICLYVSLCVTK